MAQREIATQIILILNAVYLLKNTQFLSHDSHKINAKKRRKIIGLGHGLLNNSAITTAQALRKADMKIFWLHDQIDQLHQQVFKNSLLILLLLPLVNQGYSFIQQFHMADQIVVYFYAISFATAAFILAFYGALRTLHVQLSTTSSRLGHYLLKGYRHVPMLCLTGNTVYFSLYLF